VASPPQAVVGLPFTNEYDLSEIAFHLDIIGALRLTALSRILYEMIVELPA
jgi:hypothetical protein